MRIALVNLFHDAPNPEAHIASDTLRRELSRALAARGHEVFVIQELGYLANATDGPVHWLFVPPSVATRVARGLLTAAGRDDAIVKVPAEHVVWPVASLRPDIIHSFDLANYATLALMGRLARKQGSALVAHFHGGAPARTPLLRAVERYALDRTHRLLFTTRERGLEWARSGALRDPSRVVEVFESSSTFIPDDRAAARARTGLKGKPALLHVGRLDPVKDPRTTIEGFRRALPRLPGAYLSLAWTGGPLEAELRALARDLPVSFLGPVPHQHMEDLYRGADALVQASVREVCGYAVLESLACGTPPVLSDIPPFRRLTDQGRVGRLFRPGDPDALAQALIELHTSRPSPEDVRAWFDRALSFPVLAATIEAVYESCLQEIRATGKGREAGQSEASQASSSA